MLEMIIQEVLNEWGITDIEVEHSDLSSATPDMADLFVVAMDLAEGAEALGEKIVLNSIIDREELKEKLGSKLKELNIL